VASAGLDRTVAVEVLLQRLSSSAGVRQRFEREAKTILQLSHLVCHTLATLDAAESLGQRENAALTRVS
jgi:hypothetical protein